MAISLASIRRVSASSPPRMLIFGPAGVGKTTLASEAPKPVFIQAEDGTPGGAPLESFGKITDYNEVTQALSALATEAHDYKTVVIDTIDALQPMIYDAVCNEQGWPDIESPGFGRGYVAAESKWADLIDALNYLRVHRGMNTILIGHSEVTTFSPPGSEAYSRYGLRIHKRAAGVITDAMDIVCFVNFKADLKKVESGFGKKAVHAEGTGTRWAYTEERPAFLAKNRYELPPEQIIVRGKLFNAWSAKVPFAHTESPGATPGATPSATPAPTPVPDAPAATMAAPPAPQVA